MEFFVKIHIYVVSNIQFLFQNLLLIFRQRLSTRFLMLNILKFCIFESNFFQNYYGKFSGCCLSWVIRRRRALAVTSRLAAVTGDGMKRRVEPSHLLLHYSCCYSFCRIEEGDRFWALFCCGLLTYFFISQNLGHVADYGYAYFKIFFVKLPIFRPSNSSAKASSL